MSYARARLWLGICGVGSMVVLAVFMIILRLPAKLFPTQQTWLWIDLSGLAAFVVGFAVLMMPIDFAGGYALPRLYERQSLRLDSFARRWGLGVMVQVVLYVLTGLGILICGRAGGIAGALAFVLLAGLLYLTLQGRLFRLVTAGTKTIDASRLEPVKKQLEAWRIPIVRMAVVDHSDPGFTGGIVGLPGMETILIPRRWLQELTTSELSAMMARRIEAITSGSRARGLMLALIWVVCGFGIASRLPDAGVQSVAQLVTTCCAFTCWIFLGLLTLPTVSRMASYRVDRRVIQSGLPANLLFNAIAKLDRLQDDEPKRPGWVESIFHPVPSVANRQEQHDGGLEGAWHAARTTLYLSWSCLGLVARAVHCNAGRPDLWILLPTD